MTQQQYRQVVGKNPSCFVNDDSPVDTVSWMDAQSFCMKAGDRTKQTVRLPTEAEWEFSCRAGTLTTYYSGDAEADLNSIGWYLINSSMTTHPVGQKGPNAFGIFDAQGNVVKLCQDWYAEDYYATSPAEDPQGPAQGTERVVRGGSWGNSSRDCRARLSCNPSERWSTIGFRVAVNASRSE